MCDCVCASNTGFTCGGFHGLKIVTLCKVLETPPKVGRQALRRCAGLKSSGKYQKQFIITVVTTHLVRGSGGVGVHFQATVGVSTPLLNHILI